MTNTSTSSASKQTARTAADEGSYGSEKVVTGQRRDGMGIAALVLGILTIVLCWTSFIGIILGVVGLVLGLVAHNRAKRGEPTSNKMAMSGAITSGVGLALTVLVTALAAAL
jgi:hypothetical protein